MMRSKDHVKMVVQQAVGEDAHRQTLVRVGDELEKCAKVAILLEHVGARVSTIQNVVADPTDRSSCSAWHVTKRILP